MGALVLLLASLLLVLGASAWTKVLRADSSFDALVTFGVVATASIVLALEVAGGLGELRRGVVVAVVTAISAPAIVVTRPWTWKRSIRWRSVCSSTAAAA